MLALGKPSKKVRLPAGILLAFLALFQGCAGDANKNLLSKNNPTTDSLTPLEQEALDRRSLKGTKIRLHQESFYGLTSPNPQSCAGDAKKFFPYPTTASESSFADSVGELGETIRPAFIKNISVDLTHSNIENQTNRALACSVRPTIDSKPSSCATFDLNTSDSAGLSVDGNLILIGGLQRDGTTSEYEPSEFSLILPNRLDTSAKPIWNDLIREELLTTGSTLRPKGKFGAAATFHAGRREFLLFGGATQLTTQSTALQSLADTWIFDLETRRWTSRPTAVFPRLNTQKDSSQGNTVVTAKSPSGRAHFGYLPIAGLSRSSFMSGYDSTLEKLLIVGGISQSGMQDSYLFNPTFGPEHIDVSDVTSSSQLAQWMESYHTRRISTLQSRTFFGQEILEKPSLIFNLTATTVDDTNDRFVLSGHGLQEGDLIVFAKNEDSSALPTPLAFGTIYRVCQRTDADFQVCSNAAPTNTPVNLTDTGSLGVILVRSPGPVQGTLLADATGPVSWSGFGWASDATGRTGALLTGKSNRLTAPSAIGAARVELDLDGRVLNPSTPVNWIHTWDSASGFGSTTPNTASQVPGFGAYSMHRYPNDNWYYFGGTTCRNYLIAISSSNCVFNDQIYRYSAIYPATQSSNSATHALASRAGMASAVGTAQNGDDVMVLFGGLSTPGTPLNTASGANLLFVHEPTPPLQAITLTGTFPPPLVNAQMVFSHVTRKFYLFGGMVPQALTATRGDTWELTISGTTAGSRTASWRKLNDAGMTCWPNCPAARRSHRMAEVNYAVGQTCAVGDPCSYGIFMEGGTPNGLDFFSDRWMFDPTANNGAGHWTNVNGFPARRLAAMTTYEVTLTNGTRQERALMYGGETSMQSFPFSIQARSGGADEYYLPPTLADAHVYDFETQGWNRVELLGRGYSSTPPASPVTILEKQTYQTGQISSPSALSPPPLSGALMVTRTHDSSGSKLTVPEIYLMGGRQKDGSYQPLLTQVWKFCPQSTREVGASNLCDDQILNDYSGRWFLKNPVTDASLTVGVAEGMNGIFLGAATYNSQRDRIVIVGGYRPNTLTESVTEAFESREGVLEYNPELQRWSRVPACPTSDQPEKRYGHSLSYDAQNDRLILVGGFAAGTASTEISDPPVALLHSAQSPNQIPEVWTAVYKSAQTCYEWEKIDPHAEEDRVDAKIPPQVGLGLSSSLMIPHSGFGSGNYLLQDDQCAGTGPVASNDSALSKKFSGGVTIDLERGELDDDENLLLQLTYIPLNRESLLPSRKLASSQDEPVLHIHLLSTGMSRAALQGVFQPRHLFYFDTEQFPRTVNKLAIFAESDGQLREEQLVIPLAGMTSIDRIRIERVTGSAILIDVSLQRMGSK